MKNVRMLVHVYEKCRDQYTYRSLNFGFFTGQTTETAWLVGLNQKGNTTERQHKHIEALQYLSANAVESHLSQLIYM